MRRSWSIHRLSGIRRKLWAVKIASILLFDSCLSGVLCLMISSSLYIRIPPKIISLISRCISNSRFRLCEQLELETTHRQTTKEQQQYPSGPLLDKRIAEHQETSTDTVMNKFADNEQYTVQSARDSKGIQSCISQDLIKEEQFVQVKGSLRWLLAAIPGFLRFAVEPPARHILQFCAKHR